MNIIKVTENCYCVPTLYGRIFYKLCLPLLWLAHSHPNVYKWMYFKFFKNWSNFTQLTRTRHLFK